MAYSLAIHKKGYKTINITEYSKKILDEQIDETSLREIVDFIHIFNSEEELIDTLWKIGNLPHNYKDGTIAIRKYSLRNPEDIKTLEYGVSYKEDAKYYNVGYLISYYSTIYEPIRMNTLKTLADTFSYKFKAIIDNCNNKDNKQGKIQRYNNLLMLLSNISCLSEMAEKGQLSSEEEIELRRKISEFFTKYCTHHTRGGNYEINFAELRDIAMFTIDYERKKLRKPVINKFKNEAEINKLNALKNHYLLFLEDPNLTEEQREAYNTYIDEIDYKITEISSKELTRTRGINNETTEY